MEWYGGGALLLTRFSLLVAASLVCAGLCRADLSVADSALDEKTVLLDDSVVLYAAPEFVVTESGDYALAESTLVVGESVITTLRNPLGASFKIDATTPETVLLSKNSAVLGLKPVSVGITNATTRYVYPLLPSGEAAVTDSTVTYNDYFDGVRLSYSVSKEFLSEAFVLTHEPPEPPLSMLAPACYIECYDTGLRFFIEYEVTLEGIGVSLDSDSRSGVYPLVGDLEFYDATGVSVFTIHPGFARDALGRYEAVESELIVSKTGLILRRYVDYDALRLPKAYPYLIDPSVALSSASESRYVKYFLCVKAADCCKSGGFGACFTSSECVSVTSDDGMTVYAATSCNPCDATPPISPTCCKPAGTSYAGYTRYYSFNITSLLDSYTITNAILNLSLNAVDATYYVTASHADNDTTTCTLTHTIDSYAQPPPQLAAATLSFNMTTHLNATKSAGKQLFWVKLSSTTNIYPTKNIPSGASLTIHYDEASTCVVPTTPSIWTVDGNCTITDQIVNITGMVIPTGNSLSMTNSELRCST